MGCNPAALAAGVCGLGVSDTEGWSTAIRIILRTTTGRRRGLGDLADVMVHRLERRKLKFESVRARV